MKALHNCIRDWLAQRWQECMGMSTAVAKPCSRPVFLQHAFNLTSVGTDCRLQLRVLDSTSSGGFKFKVRTIIISPVRSQMNDQ